MTEKLELKGYELPLTEGTWKVAGYHDLVVFVAPDHPVLVMQDGVLKEADDLEIKLNGVC